MVFLLSIGVFPPVSYDHSVSKTLEGVITWQLDIIITMNIHNNANVPQSNNIS